MFWPITGTAGGDLGLLIEEIVPEIRAAQTSVDDPCECGDPFCVQTANVNADDGKLYVEEHVPDGVMFWRFR